LIDIGINLTNKRFDKDRAEVIERAKSVAIKAMVVTGTNVIESQKAALLCQQYPNYLFSTAGVHPHDADHVSDDYLEKIKYLANQSNVVAIGECGLDFNRNFSTPEQQMRVFTEQVSLAAELNMPLFLHQRDAFIPWFNTLEAYIGKIPAMISHCFTGSKEELSICLDADMYIGITGWLCDERRGLALKEIVKDIPLNRLLIETDAPYLTPRTIKPKPKSSRNEASYLPFIVKALVECTDYSEQEIIQQSQQNAMKAFNLELAQ